MCLMCSIRVVCILFDACVCVCCIYAFSSYQLWPNNIAGKASLVHSFKATSNTGQGSPVSVCLHILLCYTPTESLFPHKVRGSCFGACFLVEEHNLLHYVRLAIVYNKL